MKKIILAALVAIGITACNQKGQNTEDKTAQWKEGIVGQWVYKTAAGNNPEDMHYQITLDIKADGHMTETEHYTQAATADKPAIDTDGNIFKGTWELHGDSLVKDGQMSVLVGKEIRPEAEQVRTDRKVNGFTRLVDVKPDSRVTVDMSGHTIVFVKKQAE